MVGSYLMIHLFYILGFAKNARSTVKKKELKDLQDLVQSRGTPKI